LIHFPTVVEVFDAPPPLPEKTILWAAEPYYGNLPNGDLSHFPLMPEMMARYHCSYAGALATFADAVQQANHKVWILDQFFLDDDDPEVRQRRLQEVISWLTTDNFQATDIRILMKSMSRNGDLAIETNIKNQLSDAEQKINSKRDYISAQHCQIQVRFTLNITFDQLHDRFAIIDNELWHFGATVGGFHKQVSAASRGWDAAALRADTFFNLAWQAPMIEGKKK
jgi:hypothetical protein